MTLAILIALVWWAAEYCSFASQRSLRFAADFYRAWTVLTCILLLLSGATFLLEQFLRDRLSKRAYHSCHNSCFDRIARSCPEKRLRDFDNGAVLVQHIIEWRRFQKGNIIDSGWQEVPTP